MHLPINSFLIYYFLSIIEKKKIDSFKFGCAEHLIVFTLVFLLIFHVSRKTVMKIKNNLSKLLTRDYFRSKNRTWWNYQSRSSTRKYVHRYKKKVFNKITIKRWVSWWVGIMRWTIFRISEYRLSDFLSLDTLEKTKR